MNQVNTALSSFEETIRENEAVSSRSNRKSSKSDFKHSRSRPTTGKSKSSRKLKDGTSKSNTDSKNHGESSTHCTELSSSSSTIDHAAEQEQTEDLDLSSLEGDGSFGAADDFGFGDDDDGFGDGCGEPEPAAKPRRKKKSSSKKKSAAENSEGGDCFQITYNGEENDTTQERIRRSLLRKEESARSMNSGGFISLADVDDCSSTFSRRGSINTNMSEDSFSGRQPRRSSLDHGRHRNKYGGSAGLKYGSTECEAYLSSLPPGLQVSERRRLRQKQSAKDRVRSAAHSSRSKSTPSDT